MCISLTNLWIFFLEIPIVETLCLVMHVAIFNLGYGCLGYPMMAELLPSKLRTSGLAFIMVVGGLFGLVHAGAGAHRAPAGERPSATGEDYGRGQVCTVQLQS